MPVRGIVLILVLAIAIAAFNKDYIYEMLEDLLDEDSTDETKED